MKKYYALFKETTEAIEVEFPDLVGCVTFADNWEEAIDNAIDVLAAWLAHADSEFIKEPSTHESLAHLPGKLVPIPIDERAVESYRPLKHLDVVLPKNTLKQIDRFNKKSGLELSTFLQVAAEEYLRNHLYT